MHTQTKRVTLVMNLGLLEESTQLADWR